MTTAAGEDRDRTAADPVAADPAAEADLGRTGPAAQMGPAEDPGPTDRLEGAARTLNA